MTITGNVHRVSVDLSKPLAQEPQTGHNRWHPSIPPIVRAAPGDRVVLQTRDALDGQITSNSTVQDVGRVNLNVVHPLTGPVFIEGADPGMASEALRPVPPRETAGNLDIKQLSKGVRLAIPVSDRGALFSIGDAHFAQGDGECCGTAIEMAATFHLEFEVHKGVAAERNIRDAQFARDEYYLPPELAAPRRFYATTGLSVARDGQNASEDATLAARNALLNMIDYLGYERGLSRQQAYALCSVAVDLKISELVDVPNFVVSAFLPLDIFV